MVEPRRPPREFLDWLDESYRWDQQQWWRLNNLWGEKWLEDPVYLYWNVWVNPENPKRQRQQQEWLGITPEQQEADQLGSLIQQVLSASDMTVDEAEEIGKLYLGKPNSVFLVQFDPLFRTFAAQAGVQLSEAAEYAYQYTSPNNLADRLVQIEGIDDETKASIYGTILSDAGLLTPSLVPDVEIRDARQRIVNTQEKERQAFLREYEKQASAKAGRELEDYEIRAEAEATWEKERLKKEKEAEKAALNAPRIADAKKQYLPYLRGVLDTGVKSGLFSQEQADSQFNYETSLIDRGFSLKDLPNYSGVQSQYEAEAERKAIELEQINLAPKIKLANRLTEERRIMGESQEAGLETRLREERWLRAHPEQRQPGLPGLREAAESFLGGTYAPGTRLREFIESEIPGIAESIRAQREEWWRRMNPPEPVEAMPEREAAVPTYERVLAGARADVRERGDILREAQLGASTGAQQEYYLGQLPYAERQVGLSENRLAGLLGLGQEGYFAQQRAIPKGVSTPLTRRTVAREEDPLIKALKETDFLSRYYRRPGAGTASRLRPSVRFR